MRYALVILCTLFSFAGYAQFSAYRVFSPDANRPWFVSTADLDGDGDEDVLAALVVDNKIVWYANDGNGAFGAQQVLNANAEYAKWVTTGDMDGDGDPDAVIAYGATAVFAWHANDGLGNFGAEQMIATSTGSPWALELADIDGDGDLDMATSAQGSGLHWYANDGAGMGWIDSAVDTSAAVADICAGDLDGDGDLDLLLAGSGAIGTVSWRANLGGGNFAPGQTISTGASNGIDVEAADLDGDGDLDAGYLTNWTQALGWYANLGGGSFGPATVLNSTLSLPTFLKAQDVDADGITDLLVAVKWSKQVLYYRSSGEGNFDAVQVLTDQANGAYCVAAADLDGDGDRDVLFCSDEDDKIGWCEQIAPASFGPPQLITRGVDSPTDIQLADLDGDGDLDPVASSWTDGSLVWFPNDGSGNLSAMRVIGEEHDAPAPLRFSDVDADGDQDIVVGYYDGVLGYYANDGSGGFAPLTEINNTDTVLHQIDLADLNGDGALDVLAAYQMAPGKIAWHASTGPGTFGPQQVIETAVGFLSVGSADLDGDGDMDVIGSALPDKLFWYANDGGGVFGARTDIADSLNQAYQFALGDLDGDSDADMIVVRQPVIVFDGGSPVDTLPRVIWFANDGSGDFSAEQEVADFPASTQMHVVDIDADGDPDVLFTTSASTGTVTCHLNNGNGVFGSAIGLPQPPESMRALGSGDMDGDGDPDVFCTGYTYDRLGWYENYFGSPFRIQGRVYLDLDGSGTFNAGDTTGSFITIATSPLVSYALTDELGDYTFYLNEGAYTVSASVPGNLWQLSTPNSTYSVDLTAVDPVNTGNDFGFAPVSDTTVLIPSLTASTGPCGGDMLLWLDVRNEGTRVEQGVMRLDLDPAYGFIHSVPPTDSIVGNSYFWSFEDLFYYANTRVTLNLQRPTATFIGDTLTSSLTVFRTDEVGSVTNTFTDALSEVLACSYDPNDKIVMRAGYGAEGAVDIGTEWLTYTIRFQNTGTDTAYNVMVRDLLSEKFDRATMTVIAASHALTRTTIEADGEAVFHFDGILLPDSNVNEAASHGFVKFRIALLPDQPHLTVIENSAAIHFDFNPPVITNTTVNTLVDCALWEPGIIPLGNELLEASEGDGYQWFQDGLPLTGSTDRTLFVSSTGLYSVAVTSSLGCVATSDPLQVIITQVDTSTPLQIAVVPNPFNTHARVIVSEVLSASCQLELADVHGRILMTMRGTGSREIMLDRASLRPGLYMLRVNDGGMPVGSLRVVVE